MRRPGLLAAFLAARFGAGDGDEPAAQDDDEGSGGPQFDPPEGIGVERDLAYGEHPAQRLDVYRPRTAPNGGVIVLVHGGGWRRGDKAGQRLVRNKVSHWVGRGWILASINYRLLPDAGPVVQADDVARALGFIQDRCAAWGADAASCVLMGHSAGAHLVALLAADGAIAGRQGARPWMSTIAIDTAAYDLVALMQARHFGLYDEAFGADSQYWREASPMHRLQAPPAAPLLMVCSSRRDDACGPAQAFAGCIQALGGQARVLPVDLGHFEINRQLGLDPAYTAAVDAFLAGD